MVIISYVVLSYLYQASCVLVSMVLLSFIHLQNAGHYWNGHIFTFQLWAILEAPHHLLPLAFFRVTGRVWSSAMLCKSLQV